MRRLCVTFLLVLTKAFAQQPQPLTSLPYTPSFDLQAMDRSVQPCDNFYQYSCGTWIKDNPIPADQARWDVYSKLTYENQLYLWGLLLQAGRNDATRTANQQKIGDLFHACMDETAIEQEGAAPIQPILDQINAIKSLRDLPAFLAAQHLTLYTTSMFFSFGSNQDYANSSAMIAFADAGGLGLPDRDYYSKADAKSVEIRQKYVEHVEHMFELLGDAPAAAAANAATVMRIETALAAATLTRVEERDPYKLFHKMSRAQLQAITPSFRWDDYFADLQMPSARQVNVSQPAFYRALETQLRTNSLADLKTYLRWHVIHAKARFLSTPYVQADFDFFSHYLRGVPEMQPRWKRCVQLVDHTLGEALGQVFVEKTFTPDTKARAVTMTKEIEAAMQSEIDALPWMSPPTKKQALLKLHAVVNKIGYPDKWRDYSSVDIKAGDFLGDVNRAVAFESHRELNKIGKPVDRTEWIISPPTVNAYYDPQMNDINFPAGVLQPPLFDPKMDDGPNYGNTGATMGHELTHGFDDEGRQFDAKGNLRDWWNKTDAAEFQKRADCVSDEYSQFTVVDDIKINGKLTMGEDVADLGGTLLAYIAWKAANKGKSLPPIDGFAPDQRFFIGMAQWACGSERPENLRANAITDPHSPLEYRVNGVVSNMPEFQTAFSCKLGQPMVRQKACKVW
ncbi:MAG TPA: M13 family metallopeptidase [Bryobacteraceae bacterium]|nr:M13 family metallopeptidase [Bryobacteraceae bacterium]